MTGFIINRLLQAVVVMLAMSAIVFVGVYAIGNPIDVLISPEAPQKVRAEIIAHYGLDQPLWRQYLVFLGNLLSGDLGRSFLYGVPVLPLILSRAPATIELAGAAILGATLIGIPLGLYAGYRPRSWLSRAIMGLSVLGFSVPTFWIGLILILTFAVDLQWLPAGGRGPTMPVGGVEWSLFSATGWAHLLLPALTLSLFRLALMIRLTRAGMREAILSDYVKFARAQGLPERRVIGGHVFKNISIPLVTVFGLELGQTVAFAVVTETIFSWPGMGKLIIDSITALDRPVMVGYLILITFLFIVINLIVDLVYALLDPRLRRGGAT
ncbi:MAG TPA: ABC transporter permease [Vineibacter sp.]|nr:ABC transporter permease [Vineibacter sp.]